MSYQQTCFSSQKATNKNNIGIEVFWRRFAFSAAWAFACICLSVCAFLLFFTKSFLLFCKLEAVVPPASEIATLHNRINDVHFRPFRASSTEALRRQWLITTTFRRWRQQWRRSFWSQDFPAESRMGHWDPLEDLEHYEIQLHTNDIHKANNRSTMETNSSQNGYIVVRTADKTRMEEWIWRTDVRTKRKLWTNALQQCNATNKQGNQKGAC